MLANSPAAVTGKAWHIDWDRLSPIVEAREVQKQQVLTMHRSGASVEQIAAVTDLSKGAVRRALASKSYEPREVPAAAPAAATKTEKPEPWVVLTGGELKRKPIQERRAIMTEAGSTVFYEASVNQIVAWRGVGKTNFALGLSGVFCSGGQILNFKTDRPRRVLYVDGELPLFQLQERARLFVSKEHEDNLFLFSPEMLKEPRGLNLLNPADADGLKEAVAQCKADVVILDSQSTLMNGDVLKSDFHEARQKLLRELRWMNACVIEMHHLGKNGTQRGLSKNDDILDVQMHLKKVDGWEPGDGLLFEMHYDKVRHAAQLSRGYHVMLQNGVWLRKDADDQVEVIRLLEAGKSERQVADELDIPKSTVHRIRTKARLARLNQTASAPPRVT
jgi:AAA domain/Homeodomain-like domain